MGPAEQAASLRGRSSTSGSCSPTFRPASSRGPSFWSPRRTSRSTRGSGSRTRGRAECWPLLVRFSRRIGRERAAAEAEAERELPRSLKQVIYRKSGRGAAAIPIPGPRPRPRHVPPPRATIVRPRAAGSSSVRSEPVEGPLLAGIAVTVFPGRSSRSLAGVGAVLAGWATGSPARTGAGTAAAARRSLGSRELERGAGAGRAADGEERAARRWIRSCCVSTREAIFTSEVWVTSVRSRWGTEPVACSLVSDPHPTTTATKAVSGSRKMVRMNPPGV